MAGWLAGWLPRNRDPVVFGRTGSTGGDLGVERHSGGCVSVVLIAAHTFRGLSGRLPAPHAMEMDTLGWPRLKHPAKVGWPRMKTSNNGHRGV
jgi:hypothetical protein